MATPNNSLHDPLNHGLPIVGPQAGESAENKFHRLKTLRDVSLRNVKPLPAVGLENTNDKLCFFISLIQSLLHHPRLANFCRYHHIGPRRAKPSNDRLVQHEPVYWSDIHDMELKQRCGYCQLYEFLVRYWTRHYSPGTRQQKVNKRFKKLLDRFKKYCRENEGGSTELAEDEQHDPSEAYASLLKWLEGDDFYDHKREDNRADPRHITEAFFKIKSKGSNTCGICDTLSNHRTEHDDDMLVLRYPDKKLDGRQHLPLLDLLETALNNDSDMMTCRTCSCPTDHNRITRIVHFPEVLCVKLEIFSHSIRGIFKQTRTVEIPETLDFQSYADNTDCGPINYKLFAVVKNIGPRADSGHYICFVKRKDADGTVVWKEYDDTDILEASFDKAIEFKPDDFGKKGEIDAAPFLLFYEREYGRDLRKVGDIPLTEETEVPEWYERLVPTSAIIPQNQVPIAPHTVAKSPTPKKGRGPQKKDATYKPGSTADSSGTDSDASNGQQSRAGAKDSSVPVPSVTPTPTPQTVPSPAPRVTQSPATPMQAVPVPSSAPSPAPPAVPSPTPPINPPPTPASQSAVPQQQSTPPAVVDKSFYDKQTKKQLEVVLQDRGLAYGKKDRKQIWVDLIFEDDEKNRSNRTNNGPAAVQTPVNPPVDTPVSPPVSQPVSPPVNPPVDPSVNPSAKENSKSKPDYNKLTVVKLKEILKKKGLAISGKKADLVARLAEKDEEAEDEADTNTDNNQNNSAANPNKRKHSEADTDDDDTDSSQPQPKKSKTNKTKKGAVKKGKPTTKTTTAKVASSGPQPNSQSRSNSRKRAASPDPTDAPAARGSGSGGRGKRKKRKTKKGRGS